MEWIALIVLVLHLLVSCSRTKTRRQLFLTAGNEPNCVLIDYDSAAIGRTDSFSVE